MYYIVDSFDIVFNDGELKGSTHPGTRGYLRAWGVRTTENAKLLRSLSPCAMNKIILNPKSANTAGRGQLRQLDFPVIFIRAARFTKNLVSEEIFVRCEGFYTEGGFARAIGSAQ